MKIYHKHQYKLTNVLRVPRGRIVYLSLVDSYDQERLLSLKREEGRWITAPVRKPRNYQNLEETSIVISGDDLMRIISRVIALEGLDTRSFVIDLETEEQENLMDLVDYFRWVLERYEKLK